MSEIRRFSVDTWHGDKDGEYVRFSDAEAAIAERDKRIGELEVDRDEWKHKFDEERKACEWTQKQCDSAQDDYEKLTAEVGRLRSAIMEIRRMGMNPLLNWEECGKQAVDTARTALEAGHAD